MNLVNNRIHILLDVDSLIEHKTKDINSISERFDSEKTHRKFKLNDFGLSFIASMYKENILGSNIKNIDRTTFVFRNKEYSQGIKDVYPIKDNTHSIILEKIKSMKSSTNSLFIVGEFDKCVDILSKLNNLNSNTIAVLVVPDYEKGKISQELIKKMLLGQIHVRYMERSKTITKEQLEDLISRMN